MSTIHWCCISDLKIIWIIKFACVWATHYNGRRRIQPHSVGKKCYTTVLPRSIVVLRRNWTPKGRGTEWFPPSAFLRLLCCVKERGLLFIFKIEGLLYLNYIAWKFHVWRSAIQRKNNKCLFVLSSGKAFIITNQEKAGGKLRRSAGGQHNASFELRGKDSCSINTLLFIFFECVWHWEFKGLYSAQLSLSKTHIPRPACIAKCYSPFHETWIYHFCCCFYRGKNILNAGQCLIL